MRKTTHRALLASLLATMVLVAGACGGGNSGGSGSGVEGVAAGSGGGIDAADLPPADVTIVNFEYQPAEFTATVGQEVVWVNESPAPHTVTFDDGTDSGVIRAGMGWTHTFDEPGEYHYTCTNHEVEEGVIIVE